MGIYPYFTPERVQAEYRAEATLRQQGPANRPHTLFRQRPCRWRFKFCVCGGGSGSDRVDGEREQMQDIDDALKNWYPTSILPEPQFRTQEATHRRIEDHVAELAQIVERAKKNSVYLKAPNGKPTNLTEHYWALVRTKAFKQDFGDWKRAAQIAKLLKSEPIVATGKEWKGKYEIRSGSATSYILNFLRFAKDGKRLEYKNTDTGSVIIVSGSTKETTSHGDDIHLKTVALIPQIIENAIYLGEEPNEKNKRGFTKFRYYAVALKLCGVDYTVRLTTCVGDDEIYYDHSLTQIKKEGLAVRSDLITNQASGRRGPPSEGEDRRLLSLLQVDCSKFSNTVDENGEPKSAEVKAFERKHSDIQLPQLCWIKQDDKSFGWFNPTTNAIVLCEGHNTSTALEAFWHATFCFTKTNAPTLCNKMLAYARRSPKNIKYACKKFYPELKAGSQAWFDKLGAMRFVMEYADEIENSLNNEKSFFDNLLRVFSDDEVNLVEIGRRPTEKAVAALAHAFARHKHLA